MSDSAALRRPPPLLISAAAALAVLLGAVVILRSCGESPAAPVRDFRVIGPVDMKDMAQFVGSDACAPCHLDAFRKHRDSHHARALSPVDARTQGDRFRIGNVVTDPGRDLRYHTSVDGTACIQEVVHAGRSATLSIRYAVGSGKHAVTYLTDYGSGWMVPRLSYYHRVNRWDFSPGQTPDNVAGGVLYPEGIVMPPTVIGGCFTCHSTAIPHVFGRLQPQDGILGVGCEGCHGPGREHIAAVGRKDKDIRMTRMSTLRSRLTVELCGQCHRSPVSEDPNDPFNKAQMPRLQGLALSQSACFTGSEGRLSCLTCHGAHGDVKETRAGFNRACAGCHGGGAGGSSGGGSGGKPCPIEPRGDCVDCHMPEQSVGLPTGLRYRTHWIKVWGLR